MIEYNYEDYIFLSSRINALSQYVIGIEKTEELLKARTLGELYRMLEENGIKPENNRYGDRDFDGAVSRRMTDAFTSVLDDVPDKRLFTVFTYPYDCHNLKAAVKCMVKGLSAERMLIPLGSVPPEKVMECVSENNFSPFPENMAHAAEEAREAFDRTRDPQMIDILLDCACYEDMKTSVEENPLGFFTDILRAKADSVNILTALRLIRMPSVQTTELMERAYVCGGSLGIEFFNEVLSEENGGREQYLAERLIYSGYDKLGRALAAETPLRLSEAERLCDRSYISVLETAKETLAGAETVALYLAQIESEARTLRILIAGKKAGYTEDEMRVRIG